MIPTWLIVVAAVGSGLLFATDWPYIKRHTWLQRIAIAIIIMVMTVGILTIKGGG